VAPHSLEGGSFPGAVGQQHVACAQFPHDLDQLLLAQVLGVAVAPPLPLGRTAL
jgi:hypothetical protein